MSRLFPERITIRLFPSRIVVGDKTLPCDAGHGAALKSLEWKRHCRITVVLSNHFVRYAVIPWSGGLSTPAEEEAYLRHHFGKIHGERARAWSLRASEAPSGAARLASAIDTALLEELKGAFPSSGKAKLVSVQPELMDAANRWRGAIPAAGAWLVLAEPGRACLAVHGEKGWRSVQNAKGEWLTLLERERLRLDDAPRLVLLAGAAPPEPPGQWTFHRLAAP